MNPRLFEHYKRELQHIREMGGEFSTEFPKIASRLGIDTIECSDPYVERLLEGFAFFAARVQLKIETSYSKLARHLLEMVYPGYLSPTPSMVIAEFQPTLTEGSLASGFTIKRETRMRSLLAPDEKTECDFRTSHDLTLWPIEVNDMRVFNSRVAIETEGVKPPKGVQSGLAIKLKAVEGHTFSELPINELSFHLSGSDNSGALLYEQMFRHTQKVALLSNGKEFKSASAAPVIARQGFEDSEALLPVGPRSFQGHRLLQEYFNFPQRFQFLKVNKLRGCLKQCGGDEVELVFLFDNKSDRLAEQYSRENFKLHCVPAINLFAKSVNRINLDNTQHEYHVIPDRTRPMDFEVYSVDEVEGYGNTQQDTQSFFPYYSINEKRRTASSFYSIHREPRQLSSKQKRHGSRATYVGSEVYVSLVDTDEAPYRSDLRQLSLKTYCTNRDLPLQMPVGRKNTDFNLDIGAPVESIRCVAPPTFPRESRAHSRDAWQLVSNLSLNYLSIDDTDEDGQAAAALLRQMLELYVDERSSADRRQLEGIQSVNTRRVVRQRRLRGHVEIAHGLEIRLRVDESAFEGTGAYLLGSVLERFFTRYANINSFTETVLESTERSEIERWPVQLGTRQSI